jgi:uncharacterized protein YeaO (DUF488 family)
VPTSSIDVRRVYEDPRGHDGVRVLVDRLWPRGMAKTSLHYDLWAKDVAPSTELRRWYGHDPQRFDEFSRRYLAELRQAPAKDVAGDIVRRARGTTLVLLTATRDVDHSGATVLARHLRRRRT